MRVFLALVVALAAGAFFTRPNIDAQLKVAAALFAQSKAAAGVEPRTDKLEDFYLASKYTSLANGRPTLECWGAFTRFFCTIPKAN